MKSLFDNSLRIDDVYDEAAELVLHKGDAHDFVAELPNDSMQLFSPRRLTI